PGGVCRGLVQLVRGAPAPTTLPPRRARLPPGLPVRVPPQPGNTAHCPSLVQPTRAWGLPPPPRHSPAALVHTVFGALPRHRPLVLVLAPGSHCSPGSETPSPHIGGMQFERHAPDTSSRLQPRGKVAVLHRHRSPAAPVCGAELTP